MQIISLVAENIKRLTAVEIRPDGALVQITGKNGAGKTSVLDSLWYALASAKHIQTHPIRAGANKALIRLDLGEIVVTRRFTRREDQTFTTTITVENADGARFSSPQTMLDQLIGALSFDPLQFVRMAPKDQMQTLRALVPGVDFAAIEAANEADYLKRTDINRDAANQKARAAAIVVPAGTPETPIDETALVARLAQVGEHNAAVERASAERRRLSDRIVDAQDDLQVKRAQLDRLQVEIAHAESVLADQQERLTALPDPPTPMSAGDVQQAISAARATNRNVLAAAEKARLERRALELEVEAGKLTKAMKDRTYAVAKAIADANLPVPGLAFGDGQVLLNGLPFTQASDAEQLRTSMAIAMAMAPKLKVLRVKEGSLLDEDGLRLVAEMAEERGFQVWVEIVRTDGKVGFVIEDGALKAAPVREAAE